MLIVDSFYRFHFEDSIQVAAPAEAGFAFFEDMEANYGRWHPDHLKFEWRKGRGLEVGNVFYFEERIAGKLQRKETRITEVVPGRYFAFTMVNPVFRFFLPRLSLPSSQLAQATGSRPNCISTASVRWVGDSTRKSSMPSTATCTRKARTSRRCLSVSESMSRRVGVAPLFSVPLPL